MKIICTSIGIAFLAAVGTPAFAQEVVDPASSGVELSVITTDGQTSVEQPGADTPSTQTQEGNVIKIDFDPDDVVGNTSIENTTIEHESEPASNNDGGSSSDGEGASDGGGDSSDDGSVDSGGDPN